MITDGDAILGSRSRQRALSLLFIHICMYAHVCMTFTVCLSVGKKLRIRKNSFPAEQRKSLATRATRCVCEKIAQNMYKLTHFYSKLVQNLNRVGKEVAQTDQECLAVP
jgi:hypothetical protein